MKSARGAITETVVLYMQLRRMERTDGTPIKKKRTRAGKMQAYCRQQTTAKFSISQFHT